MVEVLERLRGQLRGQLDQDPILGRRRRTSRTVTLPWASRKAAGAPCPGARAFTSLVSMPCRKARRSRPVTAHLAERGAVEQRRPRRGRRGTPRVWSGIGSSLSPAGRAVNLRSTCGKPRTSYTMAAVPTTSLARPPELGSASGGASSPGTAGTGATCRGGAPRIRTTSWSPRSCCSRPRSIGSCRSTTSSSIATPPSRPWPRRARRDVKRTLVPARLQRAAAQPARHRVRGGRPLRRAAARRRRRAAGDARHRPLHRRRRALLRLRPDGADRRHQCAPRARPRVPGPAAPGAAARAEGDVGPRRRARCRRARPTTTTRRSWTSAPPGAPRGRPAAAPARCRRSCATYRAERRGRGGADGRARG